MAAVLASSHPERLLDEAGVLGGQFLLAVDPGQEGLIRAQSPRT
jgi:hypothetical protein